jgi:hypothetical protein
MNETSMPRRGIRLAAGHQLQSGPYRDSFLLIGSSGAVQLNHSAAFILALCDGTRTREEVTGELIRRAGDDYNHADACDFLDAALDRGWITDG